MKKKLKIILNIIIWVFVLFAIAMTVIVFAATNNSSGVPTLFGKSVLAIQSDSMKPVFEKGDLIIDDYLTDEQKQSIQVGDIITYLVDLNGDGEEEVNTHRVVERHEEDGNVSYITKGDNIATNPSNDENPVLASAVLGQYHDFKIAGVGKVFTFLRTSMGFLVIIVLPLGLLFLYELYNFIMVMISVKGNKKLSAEQEEEIKARAIEEYLKQQSESASTDEEVNK